LVDQIPHVLSNSLSTLILHYPPLTLPQLTHLPSQLPEPGLHYKLYKNTILPPPAQKAGIQALHEFLTPPTPIPTSTQHPLPPPKLISPFPKHHQPLQIKSPLIQANVITPQQLKTLPSLPSHHPLLSILLSLLQPPLPNFPYPLKPIPQQKQQN
ncbi:50S ribosomal protein L10, partial [Staphylococcus aureus]|uniref:50S ribosomal protein L10 n=1 Tax=Staphylococcus aureus TaxID=1280 RepID=UPI00119D990C